MPGHTTHTDGCYLAERVAGQKVGKRAISPLQTNANRTCLFESPFILFLPLPRVAPMSLVQNGLVRDGVRTPFITPKEECKELERLKNEKG
jgi:hypothetical protein